MASGAGNRRVPVRSLAAAAAVLLLALAALGVAATLLINNGPLPEQWRAAAAAGLSQWLGTDVTVEAAYLLGPGRIALEGVRAEGEVAFYLKRVTAGFSLWDLGRLLREPLAAVRWVQVDGFDVTVPVEWLAARLPARSDNAGDTEAGKDAAPGSPVQALTAEVDVAVELADGRINIVAGEEQFQAAVAGRVALQGGQWVMHSLRLSLPGFEVDGHGPVWPQPEVYARVTASDWGAALAAAPERWRSALPLELSGMTEGELWLTGAWAAPRAWGRLQLEGLTVGVPAVAGRPYRLTGGTLVWSWRPSRGLELALEAERDETRVKAEGALAADGALALEVKATDLALPEDALPLARLGVAGRADFFGRLGGTVREPVLAGELLADGGRLFGQPVSSLKAQLQLTREAFDFTRARVVQGSSEYHLEGRVEFGREAGDPGQLQLVLRTDRGRVEALAAALGWRVPVEAVFSGTLIIGGPLGAIRGQGDIALTQGVAWGQPFDRLAGQFHYGPEGFQIPAATGRVRGGSVEVSGGGNANGPWELHVSAQDVPLQAVAGLRERVPMVSGLVSVDGTVRRAAGEVLPEFAGRVSARHVLVGSLDFAEAAGELQFAGGTWRTGGITLRRSSGGTYVAAGAVRDGGAEPGAEPVLDLSLTVDGESLADVLALTGLRLPVLAPNGRVSAQVALAGTPGDPVARIRLDAPDVYVIGYRTAVAVEMRIEDGRVHIDELSRESG
ncbi:MAG TPA: hypothetical protein VIK98_01870 [Limnochordales bacterium]